MVGIFLLQLIISYKGEAKLNCQKAQRDECDFSLSHASFKSTS